MHIGDVITGMTVEGETQRLNSILQ